MTTIPCWIKPAKTYLCRRLAMSFADFLEHLVACGTAARNGAVRDDRHAILAARRNDLVLIQERMAFDLIADQRFA